MLLVWCHTQKFLGTMSLVVVDFVNATARSFQIFTSTLCRFRREESEEAGPVARAVLALPQRAAQLAKVGAHAQVQHQPAGRRRVRRGRALGRPGRVQRPRRLAR